MAALFVAFGHICGAVGCPPPRSLSTAIVFGAFRFAGLSHVAVCIFIVLSGFCLMLPVAKSPDRRLAGGLAGFLRRRTRRILPPYYAALAVTFLIPSLHIVFGNIRKGHHFPITAGWTRGNVVSHLLLIHNLSHDWYVAWDGPTWTVATEWQIYFVFALFLLPLWRRFGMAVSVVCAAVLGWIPHFALNPARNLDWAGPWLLALFAIGMAGAVIAVSQEARWIRLRGTINWRLVAIVSAIVVYPWYVIVQDKDIASFYWFLDLFAAVPILSLSLILWCANETMSEEDKQSTPLKVLESPRAQLLGAFSYSLYLIHWPIEQMINAVIQPRFAQTPGLYLLALLLIALPAALGGAYVFYLAVERPLLRTAGASRGHRFRELIKRLSNAR